MDVRKEEAAGGLIGGPKIIMSKALLAAQLKLLEQDVSAKVGKKASASVKRKRKRAKRAKRKKNELREVASEDAKRKKNYDANVKKLAAAAAQDVSVDFVKKVRSSLIARVVRLSWGPSQMRPSAWVVCGSVRRTWAQGQALVSQPVERECFFDLVGALVCGSTRE